MTTPWKIDGFEHGDAALGVGGVYDQLQGSPTIVASGRNGGSCLEISTAAAAERVGYTPPASTRQANKSFYIYFPTAVPTALVYLAAFGNVNGPGFLQFEGATSGRFAISNNNVGRVVCGPATVSPNMWYLVELDYDSSGASARITARINSGGPTTTTRAQAASDITAFNLGTTFTTDTYTARYDDWIISLDPLDFPIGEHHIESLIASADGTHNIATSGDFDSFTTTAFSNATTTGNTFIGHRPMQLANTAEQVIRQDILGTSNYMEFLLENLASGAGVPLAARAYVAAIESGGGASLGEVHLLLLDDTPILTEGSLQALDVTDDPTSGGVNVFRRMVIAPSGGWDRTKVNGLKFRLGFADGVPDINFIDVMVEVALTDVVRATPAKVSSVAVVPTPTIKLGAGPNPDPIQALATVPTPSPRFGTIATPAKVSGVTTVPTPAVVSGGAATASPLRIATRAAVPTPGITTGAALPYTYSHGYGQGYETIGPGIVTPPVIREPATTPNIRVRVDFIHDINPREGPMPIPKWSDITAKVQAPEGVNIKRGRQRVLDRNEAGNCEITVEDMNRDLDPSNFESPYFPGITPDRRINVQATLPDLSTPFTMCHSQVGGTDIVGGGDTLKYIDIFDGIVDSYSYEYPGPGKYSKVTMRCTDLLALMSRDEVSLQTTGETVTHVFNQILNARAYTGRRASFPGTDDDSPNRSIAQQNLPLAPILLSKEAMLNGLQLAEISGGGNFFIARDGKPTYRDPSFLSRPSDSRRRFAVDGERFHDVTFQFDEQLVYYDITVSNIDGTIVATLSDAASKQRHPGRQPLEITTVLTSIVDITDRATDLLRNYREPQMAVTMLDLSNVVSDWEAILTCELWDRIQLEVPLPNGDIVSQPSIIQGIQIVTSNKRDWKVYFWTSIVPFTNLLDDANESFEADGVGTIGGWTAETNCTLSFENQRPAFHQHYTHHSPPVIIVETTDPILPPRGDFVLRADPLTDGAFSFLSPVMPVDARKSYALQSKNQISLSDLHSNFNPDVTFQAHAELVWYDASMVELSTDIGASQIVTTYKSHWVYGLDLVNGRGIIFFPVWAPLTVTARAPAGASFVQIRIASAGGLSHQGLYTDDVSLSRIIL